MPSDKILRVGIVGYGRSGRNIHAFLLKKMKNKFLIDAVCDINKSYLDEAKNDLKCCIYSELDIMLSEKNLDLVVIATPTKFHFDMAISILRAGCHIVIEKPVSKNAQSLQLIYDHADMARKKIFPFYNFRYSKDYLFLKKELVKKKLGNIFLVSKKVNYFNRRDDWQSSLEEYGGIVNAAVIHSVDQIINLFVEKKISIKNVLTRKINTKGSASDYFKAILIDEQECMYEIEHSWCHAFDEISWLICGDMGSLEIKENIISLKWFSYNDIQLVEKDNPRSYYSNEKIRWNLEKSAIDGSYKTGLVDGYYDHVYESIIENMVFPISEKNAIKTSNYLDCINSLIEEETVFSGYYA